MQDCCCGNFVAVLYEDIEYYSCSRIINCAWGFFVSGGGCV